MTFKEAFDAMKNGAKVKLPGWGGYWYWDCEKKTIMIQCRAKDSDHGGDLLDIRETERVEYTMMNMQRDDWLIANEENCPVLGGTSTFAFSDAIRYLKRGLKVARKGWNGKNSISSLRQASLIVQQKGRLSTVSMMRLAIRRLHLSELLVYRWDGWHLRQICWRKTGRLQSKSWKGEIDESNVC